MSMSSDKDSKLIPQNPSADTLKESGIYYGKDKDGNVFYKLGKFWYTVDENQNVQRIK